MEKIVPGQRWISETEPELGLGTVLKVEYGRVTIAFPASGDVRQYALDNAPLKRVRFQVGDKVTSHEGHVLTVTAVREVSGILVYEGKGVELPEGELSDSLSFNKPEERLLGGQADPQHLFNLRLETLLHQSRIRRSPNRGLIGPRIDLIPHQLYIAQEVASRYSPRVLLADEVGLGKTIEAGLIMHQMLVTGRIRRVLIIVPEHLIHQWFVEMLRRFNCLFSLFDEERCQAIEAHHSGANPFLEEQLVLCSLAFLAGDARRGHQAFEAGWDMLIVDEAHHLAWSPEQASPQYELVERLAGRSKGLLLLTATPEQLGLSSHFARLRLLDPNRFYNFETFVQEATDYHALAQVTEHLLEGKKLTRKDKALLERFIKPAAALEQQLQAIEGGDALLRERLVEQLVDQHGTGRVLFRNTRSAIPGFPKRVAHPVPLPCPEAYQQAFKLWARQKQTVERLAAAMQGPERVYETLLQDDAMEGDAWGDLDPRVDWLVTLLGKVKPAKVLLICASKDTVVELENAVRARINVKTALFHEELTLMVRDRNAAYFADEEGAQVLLCSEIGSEGRNFQFAHHLVLFDLPLHPDLLEQRIGRLDRIGQRHPIKIHIPFFERSPQAVLFHWYHDGVHAFQKLPRAAAAVYEEMKQPLQQLLWASMSKPAAGDPLKGPLADLLQQAKTRNAELEKALEKGRDRLLEMHSFRPEVARQLVEHIRSMDQDETLEAYMEGVFDHYGVHVEDLSAHAYAVAPSTLMFTDAFPGLPKEGMLATYERSKALSRDDMGFLTWDHPMVTGAMELLLGSEQGNSAVALWDDRKERSLLLEAIFVLECIAPGELQADRFLPPTPVRIVVDQRMQDRTAECSLEQWKSQLQDGRSRRLLDNPELRSTLLPQMLSTARELAALQQRRIIAESLQAMLAALKQEAERLMALQAINPNVRPEEVQFAQERVRRLQEHMQGADLRLDSLRLVWRGPSGK